MLQSVDRCLHHARKAREAMQTCLDILDTIPVIDEVSNKIEQPPLCLPSLKNDSSEEEEDARAIEIPKFDFAKLKPHHLTVIQGPAGRDRLALLRAIMERNVTYDHTMAFVDSTKYMSWDLRQALKSVAVERSNVITGFNPAVLERFAGQARKSLDANPSARHLLVVYAWHKLPLRFSKALLNLAAELCSTNVDVIVASYPSNPNETQLSRAATYLFLGGEPSEQNSAYLYPSQLVADAESSDLVQDLCMRDGGFLVVDMSSADAVLSHAQVSPL